MTVEHEDGTTTEEEETYTATVPLSLASAYANLASLLGREITDDDRSNAQHTVSYTHLTLPTKQVV